MELKKVHKIPSTVKWYLFARFFLVVSLASLPFYLIGKGSKVGFTIFLFFVFVIAATYIWVRYHFISFMVEENKITFSHGILLKKIKVVSFDKVQSLDLNKDIIQRFFDVCRLNIWTSSPEQIKVYDKTTVHKPAITLELSVYTGEWLKDFILSKQK